MSENKKSAIKLFKNIVKSKKNVRAITDALENAFEIDPEESIKWYEEVSANPDYKFDMFVQKTFFELLPKIVKQNKKSASVIFFNLLDPELEDDLTFPFQTPRKVARRGGHDLWQANQIILELFREAPKEFAKTVFDLVLKYRNMPINTQSDEILDVAAIVWYHDNHVYEEVGLLKKIENESINWAKKNDERVDEVIDVFQKESYSLAKLILVSILVINPKKYHTELFTLANSNILLDIDDVQHMLPLVLTSILPLCTEEEIRELNHTLLHFPIRKDEKDNDDLEQRKFLINSLPSESQNLETKEWLEKIGKDVKTLKTRGEHGPPMVFSEFQKEEKEAEQKFEDLSETEQEKEIIRLISTKQNIIEKSKKISLLESIESFLNRNKEKMSEEILPKLEPIIQKYLDDPDPKQTDFDMEKDQIGSSLISYPSIRATAASCQLRLTYHNPTKENINKCVKLSKDESTLVREDVARNLRYLSAVDFPTSFEIAKRFQKDNHRILFYLTDYIRFITGAHPDESFYFCESFLDTRGKEKLDDSRDFLIDMVTTITIHMALKKKNPKFEKLFTHILEDDSYNYVVKHTIAFRCKDDSILYDESLKNKVLSIYEKLFESPDPNVRNDADFFLLHVITDAKKSFLPEIKPLLEKVSKLDYDKSSDDFLRLNLIDYVAEFWGKIPEDSVNYLCILYDNNPKLTTNFHKSREVIQTLDVMFGSSEISRDSKKKLLSLLMEFVKAGWPEANLVLKTAEQRI